MTSDAAARRLLAGLVDEQALETEPIAEVRADLAALGLDPARAVAFARRLAAGAATPAAALLGRIDEAEESDDEIRRLEQADIAVLRRDLAEGTTAAAIAHAQRTAGQPAKVVGLRRRRPRRLIYGLGGVAAALAASAVFYVGLSTTQFHDDARDKVSALGTASQTAPTGSGEAGYLRAPETPAQERYRAAADPYKSADAETVSGAQSGPQSQQLTGGNLQALNEPSAPAAPPASALSDEAGAAAKSKAEADAAEERTRADQPQARLNQVQAEIAARQAAQGSGAASPATALDEAEATRDELSAALKQHQSLRLEAGESAPAPQPAETESVAATTTTRALSTKPPPFGLTQPVLALLIVDPKLVPSNLQQKDYAAGGLPARLDDARRLAGNQQVAALVTLRLADRTADAAVIIGVPAKTLALRRDFEKAAEPLPYPVSAGSGYDVILLDRR